MNHQPKPVSDPVRESLRALVDAVLAPTPEYPGADLYRERILHTLAHHGRQVLRGERYDGSRL